MPSAPLKACSFPYCDGLVSQGHLCPKHLEPALPRTDRRESSAKRGYDGDWQRFRLWFLSRHPLCADCSVERATDVHHIRKLADYPHLRLVESNCMGLCSRCHKVRTGRGE